MTTTTVVVAKPYRNFHVESTADAFKIGVRIGQRTVRGDNGCRLWTADVSRAGGYAMIRIGRQWWYAHRVAYNLSVGEVPAGLELDHKCGVRSCVNASHLEPVTHAENIRRRDRDLTHCRSGHEFTPANTRVNPTTGWRACRTCDRDRARERRAQRKRYATQRAAVAS